MNEKIRKKLIVPKIFFTILFAALFIVLTKVKLTPIFGTESKFSASVLFGPVISRFLGIGWGSGAIIFSHLFGIAVGIYKIKDITSWFTFTPIIFAGIYFAKMFKGDTKLVIIPLSCIILFLLHPIGREVWYYSFFWTIPIVVAKFKTRIDKLVKNHLAQVYAYSLGSAFTDHSIGSVVYLYFMNIPANLWIAAIPFTLVERAIIAAGITFSYFAVKVSISILQQIMIAKALARVQRKRKKIIVRV
jgi:hypothetical protein